MYFLIYRLKYQQTKLKLYLSELHYFMRTANVIGLLLDYMLGYVSITF